MPFTGVSETLAMSVNCLACREVAAQITRQPQGMELEEGHPFVLSIAAEGSQPIAYQWLYSGRRLRGETGPVLRVSAAATAVTGDYACTARNLAGSATSDTAQITVRPRCGPHQISLLMTWRHCCRNSC